MEDQLCRGRGLVVQTKVSLHLCFTQGHSACVIKQSEMVTTCAGLGDSQAKPSCESRLAAASAVPGAH